MIMWIETNDGKIVNLDYIVMIFRKESDLIAIMETGEEVYLGKYDTKELADKSLKQLLSLPAFRNRIHIYNNQIDGSEEKTIESEVDYYSTDNV